MVDRVLVAWIDGTAAGAAPMDCSARLLLVAAFLVPCSVPTCCLEPKFHNEIWEGHGFAMLGVNDGLERFGKNRVMSTASKV